MPATAPAAPRSAAPRRRRRRLATTLAVGVLVLGGSIMAARANAGGTSDLVGAPAAAPAIGSSDATARLVLAEELGSRGAMAAASRSLGRTRPGRAPRDSLTTRGYTFGVGGMLWPVPGSKTTGSTGWRVHPVYGYRSCHTGIDIAGTWGTPILAALSGRVVAVEWQKAYGLRTKIDDGSGVSTMYAHQQKALVRVGQRVSRGEVIGKVGSTGWATGPHLHFEVHRRGVPQDPLGWFLPNHRRAIVACLRSGS